MIQDWPVFKIIDLITVICLTNCYQSAYVSLMCSYLFSHSKETIIILLFLLNLGCQWINARAEKGISHSIELDDASSNAIIIIAILCTLFQHSCCYQADLYI